MGNWLWGLFLSYATPVAGGWLLGWLSHHWAMVMGWVQVYAPKVIQAAQDAQKQNK